MLIQLLSFTQTTTTMPAKQLIEEQGRGSNIMKMQLRLTGTWKLVCERNNL